MAGEFIEFFTELMFGSGAWFGLLIILGFCLLISIKVKFSSPIFIVVLLFLGLQYLEQIGGAISISSSFAWAFVIDLMGVVLLGGILLRDVGDARK